MIVHPMITINVSNLRQRKEAPLYINYPTH